MPKFKDSCGCYNRHDARTIGLVPAIVWNDMIDRAEHFDMNPMWYDQKDAAERLGIEYHRLNRAVKTLEELGRITTKGGYRPKSSTKTTWVTINLSEISYSNFRNEQNEISRNEQNEISILNDTEERDSQGDGTTKVEMRVVYLRVNPSGRAWKSQKVYTTEEEVDRIEEMSGEDNIDFMFWKSPKFVGDDSKAKFKRMKVKLIQPDVVDEDEVVKDDGKKYKKIKGGVCY